MTFDAASFLDNTTTEATSTARIPCPVGLHMAIIDKIDVRTWTSRKDASKSGLALDVFWSVQEPAILQELDMEKVLVKQGIMLELKDDGSSLDMGKGKNVQLGRLREAVGLNEPGRPFALSQLNGQIGRINVTHRTSDDGKEVFADVDGVVKP